jgi:hypothetical protein
VLSLEKKNMSKSNTSKIGLLDNACHSLQRGYEMFNKGRQKENALALKEAIIWIHHGIELSIKQLLVQSNEYLIFENIDEAVRKLAHLRRQPSMNNANVLDLFDSSESVYTVGFGKLVDRAAIMLNLKELSQGAELRGKIDALTSYRNKIVHFAVEVKLEEVINLLGELMEPFLNLLEKKITDKDFNKKCAPYIRAHAKSLGAVFRLQYTEAEERIERLLLKFNGMEVSGDYFGVLGRIILPQFDIVEKEEKQKDLRFDLFARSEREDWIIELKLGRPNYDITKDIVYRWKKRPSKYQKAKLWLIVMGTDKIFDKVFLRDNQVFVSTEVEIENLERLLSD